MSCTTLLNALNDFVFGLMASRINQLDAMLIIMGIPSVFYNLFTEGVTDSATTMNTENYIKFSDKSFRHSVLVNILFPGLVLTGVMGTIIGLASELTMLYNNETLSVNTDVMRYALTIGAVSGLANYCNSVVGLSVLRAMGDIRNSVFMQWTQPALRILPAAAYFYWAKETSFLGLMSFYMIGTILPSIWTISRF